MIVRQRASDEPQTIGVERSRGAEAGTGRRSFHEGSQSILVSCEEKGLGLGAADQVAGMGGSAGNSWGEYCGGGALAASRRRISVFCVGDGPAHAADLLSEGRATGVAVVDAHSTNDPLAQMTIASVRIYFWSADQNLQLRLSHTHGGFGEWFVRRLKAVRPDLRGPEAKGVNIVNFMLYENSRLAGRIDEWRKRMYSFEYRCVYDLKSLAKVPPLENVERLMGFTAGIAAKAPWPQVHAVGRLFGVPLTDDERASLIPYLQWPRKVGKLARQMGHLAK